MLKNPGGINVLSTAMIVNATGSPLLVPNPTIVTVCATVIERHRRHLGRLETDAGTRIAEVLAFRLLIAIVLMKVEVGGPAILAGLVTIAIGHAARRRLRWLRAGVVAANE